MASIRPSTNEKKFQNPYDFFTFPLLFFIWRPSKTPEKERLHNYSAAKVRNSLCSRQDIPCVSSRTIRVFRAWQSFVASRTFLVFQSATMHMPPFFGKFGRLSRDLCEIWFDSPKSRGDRLNSHIACEFKISNGSISVRMVPILTMFARNWSRRPKFCIQFFV